MTSFTCSLTPSTYDSVNVEVRWLMKVIYLEVKRYKRMRCEAASLKLTWAPFESFSARTFVSDFLIGYKIGTCQSAESFIEACHACRGRIGSSSLAQQIKMESVLQSSGLFGHTRQNKTRDNDNDEFFWGQGKMLKKSFKFILIVSKVVD